VRIEGLFATPHEIVSAVCAVHVHATTVLLDDCPALGTPPGIGLPASQPLLHLHVSNLADTRAAMNSTPHTPTLSTGGRLACAAGNISFTQLSVLQFFKLPTTRLWAFKLGRIQPRDKPLILVQKAWYIR